MNDGIQTDAADYVKDLSLVNGFLDREPEVFSRLSADDRRLLFRCFPDIRGRSLDALAYREAYEQSYPEEGCLARDMLKDLIGKGLQTYLEATGSEGFADQKS